ncbi:Guanine deaminase [Chionoecetes opilio]|uniref:Guanine deaminase n=1 Tax=Chionoecetes opilio TaxID=41210 RepID=A0A8J4Y2P6_CHIOP|nr:Guanine deaminase [Chionoecetes opilio]
MPGLIDTHVHASQFPNNGLCLDLPLLEWLQKYTFPTERSFSDLKVARDVYSRVLDRMLRNGTTTASYFATAHLPATKVLAATVAAKGQRALVGKVNMMMNCPENYREASLEECLRETEEFIIYTKNLQSSLVMPIITPRFAVSCPEDQLRGLGDLASKYKCHVQSHLCESMPEIEFVKKLFPESRSYTHLYHATGLLTEKTIMAHCVWLDDEELRLLAKAQVGVAHCPSSNLNLFSGHCNVRRLLQHGVKVGLGTDCSGGYSPSVLDAMRRALQVSSCVAMDHPAHHALTLAEAFHLATLGGAQAVSLDDRTGNFEAGKEFDAILVDVDDTMEDKIHKFLYNGDDRNMVAVYVAGRRVSARRGGDILAPEGKLEH